MPHINEFTFSRPPNKQEVFKTDWIIERPDQKYEHNALTPFYAPGTQIPVTQKEIEKRLRRDKCCAEIGNG